MTVNRAENWDKMQQNTIKNIELLGKEKQDKLESLKIALQAMWGH